MTALPPLVAIVVATFPLPVVQASTHAEFIAWARTQAGVDVRIIDFLAEREDCAGATPEEWMRIAQMGTKPWFTSLPGAQRNQILNGVVGIEASNAFMDWAMEKLVPRPSRAKRRALRAA